MTNDSGAQEEAQSYDCTFTLTVIVHGFVAIGAACCIVTARSHACEHTNNESVAMHVVFWCRRNSMSDEEQVGPLRLESISGFWHKSWSLIEKAPEKSADLWSPPKLSSFPGYNGITPHNRSTTML
jgi:hypothetical protein